jgi:Spy/CpxP family protein refolding chaperone
VGAKLKTGFTTLALGLVALLGGFGGAYIHGQIKSSQTPPSLHEQLHKTLKLSGEQDRRLHLIENDFKAQKSTLEDEMRLANRELADAIAADKAYSPKVQLAIDHFHHAMGALQKASVEHVFAMRAILTPQQQATFDSQVRNALLASGEAGDDGQQSR